MEKYGVVTKKMVDGEKVGAVNIRCPKCSMLIDPDLGTPKCDSCGTEPFEEKKSRG